jgi:hypothetical protein
MALVLAAWRWFTPRTIYRDRLVPVVTTTAAGTDTTRLRPVTELQPRIIRSDNVQN